MLGRTFLNLKAYNKVTTLKSKEMEENSKFEVTAEDIKAMSDLVDFQKNRLDEIIKKMKRSFHILLSTTIVFLMLIFNYGSSPIGLWLSVSLSAIISILLYRDYVIKKTYALEIFMFKYVTGLYSEAKEDYYSPTPSNKTFDEFLNGL